MTEFKPKFNIHIESVSALFIIALISAFILAGFFIGFSLPIYILSMSAAFILSFLYPRAGIFAIIYLTIVFERFFTLAPLIINKAEYKLYPIDIIMAGIFIAVLFQFLKERFKVQLIKNDLVLLAFVLLNVAYFLASYSTGANSYLAFSSLKNYALYSLLYFAIWILFKTRADIGRIFNFFLAGALTLIGFVFYGLISGEGLWTQFTPLSTSGVRTLAFTHGLYLSIALISVLAFLTVRSSAHKKYLFWLSVVWTAGIIGTMMRHLWISLILAAGALFLSLADEKRAEFKKLFARFGVVAFAAVLIFFYTYSLAPNSRLAELIQGTFGSVAERGVSITNARSDESFEWRELVWRAAYKDFKESPVLGIGTGKNIYVEKMDYRDYVEVRNIHNSYLTILIQLGAFGFIILALFIYLNIRQLAKHLKRAPADFYSYAVFGTLAVYLVAFMFQPYLETNLLSIFFWMGLGLSRAISANPIKEQL